MKFKVTEVFYSLQGEGSENIGKPSVFLRLFGCNLKCQGFGMPKGELSTERFDIAKNIEDYNSIEDIPLTKTGCDSFVSWDPAFRKFSNSYTPQEVVDLIKDTIKDVETNEESKFLHIGKFKDIDLVITGGEPLLAWQRVYPELFDIILKELDGNVLNLTFETNGTQKLHQDFIDYLNSHPEIKVTFSISPKLSASGEEWSSTIKPESVETYSRVLNSKIYLKFVVDSEESFDEVERAVNEYNNIDEVRIMSVGGCYEEYTKLAPSIAKLCMQKGYRYTPRLHVDLFRNSWGV